MSPELREETSEKQEQIAALSASQVILSWLLERQAKYCVRRLHDSALVNEKVNRAVHTHQRSKADW